MGPSLNRPPSFRIMSPMKILVALLLAFPGLALSAPDEPSTVEVHLRTGDKYFAEGNNEAAVREYLAAEAMAPKELGVLVRLTRVHNDMGRLLLRKSPDAELYYRKAIEYAERLRDAHPNRAESFFFLALCHGSLTPFKSLGEKLELSRDVRANAEKTLEIDSTFTMAYVILGIYYRGVARLSWVERTIVNGILGKNLEGTYEDSERVLKRALALEPNNLFAHAELASTYRSMERHDEAIAALKTVLALPATNARERMQQEDAQRMLKRMETPQ